MATTFSDTFKNALINSVVGNASMSISNTPYYMGFYSGTQPAGPSTTPSGSPVITTVMSNIPLTGVMSSPSGGISQTSVPLQTNSNADNSVSVTFARIFSNGPTALMDTPVSLAGGGGGVIVPTLTSTGGSKFVVNFFSVKIGNTNGTLAINNSLRDAILTCICNTPGNIAALTLATINAYTGTPPATADAVATGTLLWTKTTGSSGSSWTTATGGVASLALPLDAAAIADGTVGYIRVVKGTYCIQGSAGTTGTDFVLSDVVMTTGLTYSLTDASVSLL